MSPPVALVTGASGAFGAAVARLLDGRGYQVALHWSANEEPARLLAKELANDPVTVQADVRDWPAVAAMEERIRTGYGPVAVLVNAAAVRHDGLMAAQAVDEWADTIQVNLLGTFHTCRAVLPYMLRRRWGRVVNVVSPAGLMGSRGQTAYSASKAGVVGMTRSLALECARRKVTVNALSPGFMDTPLTAEVPAEVRAGILARVPTERFGTVAEIAAGVGFLLDADYMTGQVLSLDGGLTVS